VTPVIIGHFPRDHHESLSSNSSIDRSQISPNSIGQADVENELLVWSDWRQLAGSDRIEIPSTRSTWHEETSQPCSAFRSDARYADLLDRPAMASGRSVPLDPVKLHARDRRFSTQLRSYVDRQVELEDSHLASNRKPLSLSLSLSRLDRHRRSRR